MTMATGPGRSARSPRLRPDRFHPQYIVAEIGAVMDSCVAQRVERLVNLDGGHHSAGVAAFPWPERQR